jgi:putative membrane protein
MSSALLARQSCFAVDGFDRAEIAAIVGILAGTSALNWICAARPASLPVWAPWEFSWVESFSIAFVSWWYARGLCRTSPARRPALARRVMFLSGVAVIWGVLDTHFLYLAEHMFFLNRVQHVAMHHLGPFLIALAWPGETIARGMPALLRRLFCARLVGTGLAPVQRPIPAAILFAGLVFLWLIPPIHFAAMLDPPLFRLMNWSMVVDGLLFWFLVLDPRPQPPSGLSFAARFVLAMSVQIPQIFLGGWLVFARGDLYPFYALCGRVFPAIGALQDQQIGGLIVLFPGGMMSAAAALILVGFTWSDERRELASPPPSDGGVPLAPPRPAL